MARYICLGYSGLSFLGIKKVDNTALSTDEVLAYPKEEYASCPRFIAQTPTLLLFFL